MYYFRIPTSMTTEVNAATPSAVSSGRNDSRNDPPPPK